MDIITIMSLAEIRDYLSYDPESGVFRWTKSSARRITIGDIAGNVNRAVGHRRIRFQNKYYLAHRLAWFFMHGEMPPEIDHKNRQPDDNRFENLRLSTSSQNKCNSGIRANNTSGYRGVSFYKQTSRWAGEVRAGGRRVWSGYFGTAEEAARARDVVAAKHHGEFVWLNFPVA